VSVETFRRVALEDSDHVWELECGRLTRKPPMTTPHNALGSILIEELVLQLPRGVYQVRSNAGHIRIAEDHYAVPDVAVIPRAMVRARMAKPHDLEEYSEPLPFIAEVWSRSTGGYDIDRKLPAYRARGDLEIWRIHPYERTVVAWRRGTDGEYTESRYTEGEVAIDSLPGVVIDVGRLFASIDG
jgi:Uma2 family endonuclease